MVVELGREDVREVVVGVFRVAYLIREEEIAIQSVFDARTAFPWPDRVGERVVDYELLVGGLDEQQVDPDHAEAWIPELKRRLAEVDSGSVELMDWDQVRARIEERLLTGR